MLVVGMDEFDAERSMRAISLNIRQPRFQRQNSTYKMLEFLTQNSGSTSEAAAASANSEDPIRSPELHQPLDIIGAYPSVSLCLHWF